MNLTNLKNSNSKAIFYYSLLLIIAIIAFFQVSFFLHPLKYDLIDQAYPWKFFIGECLQDGLLPLWNPYQLLGSPIHADPQSSAWYPIVWFLGYFFGYNIYTISIDFIFHIFLAGAGMYYLIRSLKIKGEIAFLAGVSYMLCGFFIGNAQHFMWIISGAWIPFIIGVYIRLSDTLDVKYLISFVILMFFFITGGYPAFIITTGYFILLLFCYHLIRMIRAKETQVIFRYLTLNVAALILILLVSAVIIVGLYHLTPAMTREEGVLLKQALFCPFSLQSFISFIYPFGVIRDMNYYNTDLSMSNGYFGIIFLISFLLFFFTRKSILKWIFLIWGLIMLGLAVGDALPVREFSYNYIPLMNLFRFPSLFRVFAIISFITLAAWGLNGINAPDSKRIKYFRLMAIGLFSIILFITIFIGIKAKLGLVEFRNMEIFVHSDVSTISQHVFFQGIIQLLILALLIIVLFYVKKTSKIITCIVILGIADLIITTQLNAPYTVYYHQFKSKNTYEFSRKFPEGFPIPNARPVKYNNDRSGINYEPLWRNLNIFQKQIAYDGYNPVHLNGYEYLADSLPALFNSIITNPPIFLSYRVFPEDSLIDHLNTKEKINTNIYLNEKDILLIQQLDFQQGTKDTIIYKSFSPSEFRIETITTGNSVLTLQQNNYHGWKVKINGDDAPLYTSNFALISTVIPSGRNEVVFYYNPADVKTGFYISLISLMILIVARIFLWLTGRQLRDEQTSL